MSEPTVRVTTWVKGEMKSYELPLVTWLADLTDGPLEAKTETVRRRLCELLVKLVEKGVLTVSEVIDLSGEYDSGVVDASLLGGEE